MEVVGPIPLLGDTAPIVSKVADRYPGSPRRVA